MCNYDNNCVLKNRTEAYAYAYAEFELFSESHKVSHLQKMINSIIFGIALTRKLFQMRKIANFQLEVSFSKNAFVL